MNKIILSALLFAITRIYASGDKEIVSHLVRPHETIFRISLMHNSTVNDIIHANPGLKPEEVRSGMTIKVPKDTKVRDSAFVSAFLKFPSQCTVKTSDQNTPVRQADENPFMRPSGQGKTIEQIIQESVPVNTASQSDNTTQNYTSEELQNRYLELRKMAAADNSIKVVDMTHIKVATEAHTVDK